MFETPNTPKITELRERFKNAHSKKEAFELRYSARRKELEDQLKATLLAEFPPNSPEWNAIVSEFYASQKELQSEINSESVKLALTELPHPEGTILTQWEHSRWPGPIGSTAMKPTGKKAIMQVFKEGDPFPSNRRWGRPSPGNVVLRELKKDGTPGTAATTWRYGGNSDANFWFPEGQEPPFNLKFKEKTQ